MIIDVVDAFEQLQRLAAELGERGFDARVRAGRDCPATLSVTNAIVPVLTESVFTAPKDDGQEWFWFPWPAPIGPVEDVQRAADRIETVLAAEVRRPAS
ncbi:hypothetical protein GCM10010149_91650 [Nonomuraea roseoviolacea subsp. roseoviolacea]|uniref:Uncharacterized protein n=1 Tax=Nonomuraea roseoviolacea subsp. carminata TaxID=160689 RepID=A0ABT1JQI6_9ACTN|nr:hypothetical protein [Nonomuraea roseoviolacea]MCP2343991.1 hypothetical protein [Nonomuraea roseoviolacea subsp. carminata]